ncbi:hypothetical protein K1T71_013985 [Dendrolimus kikuchii]|uniref:Uncharacterized protein n=1 Tax=Dendrolimus kikuchii TaxID=765133 RepID=A0ACC1CGC2_9NEOP|nr:hypothetical protein K1T71_013985 [Dendrolimus kikuchii]
MCYLYCKQLFILQTEMKLILILSGLLTIQAGVIKREICAGVTIYGVCHKREILYENIRPPFSLAVDQKSNILYFSHELTDFVYTTARFNLDTKEFKNIVAGGFDQVVDRNSHDVYIGTNYGFYKYDPVDDKATFIGAKDVNTWNIYYNDSILYYVRFPKNTLNTFQNGVSKKFLELQDTNVDDFIIDNEFIYFTNDTGLYSQKKGTNDTVLYNCPCRKVKKFTLDTKGTVHICMQDGVYVVKKDTLTVEKIVDIDFVYGCAFDKNNNILYSDFTKLVRFLPVTDEK